MGSIYSGTGLDERYVGELRDDCIYLGRGVDQSTFGRVDKSGRVYGGHGVEEVLVGIVDEGGRIYRGAGANQALIGRTEQAGGRVFAGSGMDERAVGRVEAPRVYASGGALLLLDMGRTGPERQDPGPLSGHTGGLMAAFGAFLAPLFKESDVSEPDQAHVKPEVAQGLGSVDARDREQALLRAGEPDPKNIQILVEGLHDPAPVVQATAVGVLGRVGTKSAVPLVLPLLDDGNWRVRQAAALVLKGIGDARSVDALVGSLEDSDWDVRIAAVEALGQFHEDRVIDALHKTMSEAAAVDDRFLAVAVADALLWLSGPEGKATVQKMHDALDASITPQLASPAEIGERLKRAAQGPQDLLEVPADIEEIFDRLKKYGATDDVEDEDAGLRHQYRIGILSREELNVIYHRGRKLEYLMARGYWRP